MTMIWTDADHLEGLKNVIKSQERKLAEMQMALDAAYKALTHAQCDIAYAMHEGPRGTHLLQLRFDAEMLEFDRYAIESLMQVVAQKLAPYIKDLQEKMKDGGS